MFQNFSTHVLGFPSQTQQKKEIQENGCQTDGKKIADSVAQVTESRGAETQTTAASASNGSMSLEYNENDLASFLQNAQAMLEYELQMPIAWDKSFGDDEESQIEKIHHFPSPLEKEKRVSSIGWSKTGGTLAVGFSEVRHDNWSNHESCVAIYTVTNRPSAPTLLSTPTCVTSLRFHPSKPSILLIGLFTGEVMVWDRSHDADGEWTAVEKRSEHRGHVKHVGWSDDHIISTGSDGYIIMRKYSSETATITTLQRFKITEENVKRKEDNEDHGVEITGFSGMEEEECVVGLASGGLLHCRLSNVAMPEPGPHPENNSYLTPVTYTYQRHASLVTAIKYAPTTTTAKMFAAASADGHIRIFKFREAEPKWVLRKQECVLDVFWSKDGSVLGFCGWDNTVRFTKINTGKEISRQIELRGNQAAVMAEASSNRTMVAVGTTSGSVEVWRTIL